MKIRIMKGVKKVWCFATARLYTLKSGACRSLFLMQSENTLMMFLEVQAKAWMCSGSHPQLEMTGFWLMVWKTVDRSILLICGEG